MSVGTPRANRRRTLLFAAALTPLIVGGLSSLPASARVASPGWRPRVVATTVASVDIEWTPVAGEASGYRVSRNGTALADVGADVTSYSDVTAQPSSRYTYDVAAIGTGTKSSTIKVRTPRRPDRLDVTAPTAPDDIVAVAQADGSVLLDWQYGHDDSDISAYVIYRNGEELQTVDSGTLRYVDPTPPPGSSYEIEALDVVGNESAREAATPTVADPSSPIAPSSTGGLLAPRSIATGIAAKAFNASPLLRRYPYLTDVVNSPDNSVGYATVNWATDRSATTGTVQWGQVAGDGSCNPNISVVAAKSAFTVNTVAEYQWTATLSLAPNTQYCYRVYLGGTDLLAGDASPRFFTQLPTGSNSPVSFAVFGDWGSVDSASGNPDQANLYAQLASSGVRFALTTGDNSYPSGSQDNYGDLIETGPSISAVFGPQYWPVAGSTIPLFPAIGNHGLARSDANHPHFLNWPQTQATAGSGGRYSRDNYCCAFGSTAANNPSAWYAFDSGRVRIYVLQAAWSDTNIGSAPSSYAVDGAYQWTPGTAQYQWLKNDLSQHPGQVKFAVWHYPMFSDQKAEATDTYLQGANSLQGLLDQYGVKFGFAGHAHIYQRNTADSAGLTTWITGGGGAKLQSIGEAGCSSTDAYGIGWSTSSSKGNACGAAAAPGSQGQVFHFIKVTVSGSTVTVAPTNSFGQTFDVQTFSIGSGGGDTQAPSTPGGFTATAASAAQVNLAWNASTDNVGVTGYVISRNGAPLATATGTTFADTTTAPNTTYTYTVSARDAAGNSSGVATATVATPAASDAQPPSIPTAFTATAIAPTQVNLAWTASTDNVGVTGYAITRNGSPLTTVTGTTFADTTTVASTAYTYTIVARDAAGNSSGTATAGATTPASSGAVTVPASADAYTDATTPSTNYGTAATVYSDTSPARNGYFQFNVSGITGTVTTAKLRVYVNDATVNAPPVYATSNTWTETGITTNNQPAPTSAALGDFGAATIGTWLEYNVTGTITGNGTYSYVFVPQSSDGIGFASRTATANQPQLVLTTSG